MKNKTTKTIACVIASLTLSACVGSVNVPSDESDNANRDAESGSANRAITANDLQRAGDARNGGRSYIFLNDSSQQSWTGTCVLEICSARYPNTIGITPLADNTGTATYSGSIHVQFINQLGGTTDRTAGAKFKINFDENKVLYDGTIGELSLKVRADFTSRGLITGTLSLDRNDSYLLGVIGQNEMAGSFTTSTTSNADFAGGFTASRD